jgi:hypothetical protein
VEVGDRYVGTPPAARKARVRGTSRGALQGTRHPYRTTRAAIDVYCFVQPRERDSVVASVRMLRRLFERLQQVAQDER